MMKKCSVLIASAALATVLVTGTAISQLAEHRAFPDDRTHATEAMIAAHPDRF